MYHKPHTHGPAAQGAAVTSPWEGTPIEGALAWSLRQGDLSAGRSAASGDVRDPPPCSQRNIDISKLKSAEKTSRLMSPFSKDETGHESWGTWYQVQTTPTFRRNQKEGANRSHGGAIRRPSEGPRADASAAACGPAAQGAAVTSPWGGIPIEGALA